MRATSVRENAKSNSHRKTHWVEPDGTDGEFTHLTRGGLPSCERRAGKRLFLAVRNALLLRWIFFPLKRVILFFRGWVFFPVRLGI